MVVVGEKMAIRRLAVLCEEERKFSVYCWCVREAKGEKHHRHCFHLCLSVKN